MNKIHFKNSILSLFLAIPGAAMLSGCQGIFSGIYDEPEATRTTTSPGVLYVDASDWGVWHYIDLTKVASESAKDFGFNPSSLLESRSVNMGCSGTSSPEHHQPGIYTYRFDVMGVGLSNYKFLSFSASEAQEEPENWTFAVHRNNVRTNGCQVYETAYQSFDQIPTDKEVLASLKYTGDEWNELDVWVNQDKMLSGIIGCQGIEVNNVLSSWLKVEIPPMPPIFKLNNHIFILRLPDETYAALQLADYINSFGTKCCLTINYKYPLGQ